jgi:outer membrane murein-binding lipoprotein Lpp
LQRHTNAASVTQRSADIRVCPAGQHAVKIEVSISNLVWSGGTMVAESAPSESSMEARIARLESDVSHLRSDVSEIKVDLRSLRDKIDHLDVRMNARFETVNASIASAKIWALSLYIALAAVNLGTLARGFGWI